MAIVRTNQFVWADSTLSMTFFAGLGYVPTIGRILVLTGTAWNGRGIASITQTGVNWTKITRVVNTYSGVGERKPTVEIWVGDVVGPGVSSSFTINKDLATPACYGIAQYSGAYAAGVEQIASAIGNPSSNPATMLSGTTGIPSSVGQLFVAALAHNNGLDAWSSVAPPSDGFSQVGKNSFNYTGGGQTQYDQQRLVMADLVDAVGGAAKSTSVLITGLVEFWTGAIISISKTPPPNPAVLVAPSDGAPAVPITQQLQWAAPTGGTPVASYDVYFGTSYADVLAGTGGTFKGNQVGLSYNPTLAYSQTYYWRIDTVNVNGTTAGSVWSFTVFTPVAPNPPTIVGPGDGSTGNPNNQQLNWAAPSGGDPYTGFNVYIGLSLAHVTAGTGGTFKGYQVGVTYNPGTLLAGETYYWRIETVGPGGTTTGAVWSFGVFSLDPYVTNISPENGSTAKVGGTTRFSLRDPDTEIDPSKLQLYVGTGSVFYRGGTLPEKLEPPPTFYFEALSGSPGVYADRSILPDDFLRISKSVAGQNQEAVYLMGGLEAPAEPDAPLMAEFTLRLNRTEVTVDPNFFTGVLVGLLIGNKGLTVKFFTNAGVQSIQVHDAALTTSSPPSGTYISSFDWDEAVAQNADGSNTYKILWHPQKNLVRLYVRDPNLRSDLLLLTGQVSDFPTVPVPERRRDQPWMFFGHGNYIAQTSISEWKDVYLHNSVSSPIWDGIIGGEHVTKLTTNNPNYYNASDLPRDSHQAWQRLPDSFGTIGGGERITAEGLTLERTRSNESIGFYRTEPGVAHRTVLDFRLSGEVVTQEPLVETSGIEVYIDDGTKQARFALLQDANGTQYVGLLRGISPGSLSSYVTAQIGFTVERNYRLILTPGVGVELIFLVGGSEGIEEIPSITVPYSSLPDTGLPGPGIGFLHNATSGGATARMTVRQIRYTTNSEIEDWNDFVSLSPVWTKVGSGSVVPATVAGETNLGANASIVEAAGVVTVSGLVNMSVNSVGNYLEVLNGDNPGIYLIDYYFDENTVSIVNPAASGADSGNPRIQWREIIDPTFARISDASSSDNTLFKKEYITGLQSDNGWSLEFRARVVSYTHDPSLTPYLAEGLNPIRSGTGFMVQILDGTYRTALVFAEAGPPYGKVVVLATFEEPYKNLLAIRSQSVLPGSYSSVDWTKFHLYRFEKTVGGQLRLFVDEGIAPIIDFDQRDFPYPPHVGGGNPRVEIGHGDTGILTVSDFQFIKFSTSDGYDVSCKEVLSETELLARFLNGVGVIIELES